MRAPTGDALVPTLRDRARHVVETVRRAFAEFLTIPTFVIVGFLLLTGIMYAIDVAAGAGKGAGPHAGWRGLFSDTQAARDFLGVIAGSIITVTSITFSLLLIAVQQGAAALTSLVFDQFLRRRTNQLYFGFFIGLALYSLVVLATINPSHQPVYSVAMAGLMTVVALYMLILLIYTTIDQMRPVVIMKTIHDHTLWARERQRELLRKTRRAPRLTGTPNVRVAADRNGFLARLDTNAIVNAAGDVEAEVVILVSIGDYVACDDPVAEIRMTRDVDVAPLELPIRQAVILEDQRDLDTDPAFGIDQLATIGWTSISTAKSNPSPGLLAIWNLRDVLARWLRTDEPSGGHGEGAAEAPDSCVVYPDNVLEQLMRAFESLTVVASESMQHQSAAEIYRTLAGLFHLLPPQLQQQTDDLLRRSLSGLGDHILTADLEGSLLAIADALALAGRVQASKAIGDARQRLACSVGHLNSRSTRTAAAKHLGRQD
jgi:uncharacterized membrane protein